MVYGTGKHRYELIEGWAKCPDGWSFKDVCGISIDAMDRVYILSRSDRPVTVFDREGNFLTSWGEGLFKRAHGSCIGSDGSVYCTDDGNHTVTKFGPDGKVLLTLGNKDQPSDSGYVHKANMEESLATIKKGSPPFNRPTGVALSCSGEIYVSDGYGNARIHKFTSDGILLFSWGEPGRGQGSLEFLMPFLSTDGNVSGLLTVRMIESKFSMTMASFKANGVDSISPPAFLSTMMILCISPN